MKNTALIPICTALLRSQSEKMMRGDFPPSSRETFFTLLRAQLFMMCFPTSVEPVNPIFRTSGWSESLWPTSEPDPGRMLTTPLGMPAFRVSSANFKAVSGVTWAGLITTVFPAARQAAVFQDSIIRG